MKYENKKILIISIFMIIFLGFLSYRNLENIRIPDNISPLPPMPKIEIPPLEEMMTKDIEALMRERNEHNIEGINVPNEISYVAHTIPGVLNFEHPAHWKRQDIVIEEKYKEMINVLFMIHSTSIIGQTIIAISEIKANDINSSMEIMKEIFRQENINMNILKREEKDNVLSFSAEYHYPNGQIIVSREKIFSTNNKFYLFTIIAFKERAEVYSAQIEHIINSIQIIR